MDVTDVLRRLLRLRLAVGVVALIAIAAAAFGFFTAGSSRQAGAAMVIVPPKADVAGGGNPLLNLDYNLTQLAVVLSSAMQSASVADALDKADATAGFTISTVTGDNPSFAQLSTQLVFRVTGSTDAVTLRTTRALIDQARLQLKTLQDQAGVTADSRATLLLTVPPTTPEPVAGGRLRSSGALGVGVLVLGLVLVLAVDALRRRRKPGSGDLGDPGDPGEPGESTTSTREPADSSTEPETAAKQAAKQTAKQSGTAARHSRRR